MSISKSKIKKLFGKSTSFDKESRDADRTEGQWGTSPEEDQPSFRGSDMTLPSSPRDVTSYPDSLPTSPSEKKKKRFPTWRSKKRNKDKEFLRSTGELFNHRRVISPLISNVLYPEYLSWESVNELHMLPSLLNFTPLILVTLVCFRGVLSTF